MNNGLLLLFLLLVTACAPAIHQRAVGDGGLSQRQSLSTFTNTEATPLCTTSALDICQKAYLYSPDKPLCRCVHGACCAPMRSGGTLTAALLLALHIGD